MMVFLGIKIDPLNKNFLLPLMLCDEEAKGFLDLYSQVVSNTSNKIGNFNLWS